MKARAAALLTTTALAAALIVAVPGTAHAETVLTPSQALEQLTAVAGATTSAAALGFTETIVHTDAAKTAFATDTTRYDPVTQRRLETTVRAADGSVRNWLRTTTADYRTLVRDAATVAAITYAGKPYATWYYRLTPTSTIALAWSVGGAVVSGFVDAAPAPGQPTVQILTATTSTDPDGTQHWTLTARDDSTLPVPWTSNWAITADATGRVSGMVADEGPTDGSARTYFSESISYGRPTVTLPTATHLISLGLLTLARDSVHLRNRVARASLNAAAMANSAAGASHRRTYPRDVWTWTSRYVARANLSTRLVRWYRTTVGSVVYARNPFTRELVAYRVSIRYGKAVVLRMA
jgi:hypothetical protein